jgi:hypothetical protein
LAEPATAEISVSIATDSALVSIPSTMRILAGKQVKGLKFLAGAVSSPTLVMMTATMGDRIMRSTVVLLPYGVKGLSLTPNPVVGGNTVTGVVTLECAAGPGDITVNLASSKRWLAQPDAPTLVIPHGQVSGSFGVSTAGVSVDSEEVVIRASANQTSAKNRLVITPE